MKILEEIEFPNELRAVSQINVILHQPKTDNLNSEDVSAKFIFPKLLDIFRRFFGLSFAQDFCLTIVNENLSSVLSSEK